ncbi:Os05g0571400 [Oryza sativa Japonica Group]|uniref:Os05g0571400 protein n=1 Tax=Oryza sativa subsp. japonica TaxID=39947 RepID=A0A0P0WR18_ORYSJ|nr:Os05g0571400 [Oryza sativa Japonica Group]
MQPQSSAVIAAAMDDGGGHRRRRVIEPRDCRSRTLASTTQDKHRSLLLDKVRASHEEALERLRPAAVAADLDAGLCFGLLDPVSNVIVNAVLTAAPRNRKMRRARRRTRRRRRSRRRRSLDGSVTFLTSFFPYLPEWEAVYYLLLADADVLVAARLVVQARGLRRFGFTSGTTAAAVRLALRCAALAVKHPHPDRLVHAWMSLSRRAGRRRGARAGGRHGESVGAGRVSLARPGHRRAALLARHASPDGAPPRDPGVLPPGARPAALRRAAVSLPPELGAGRPLLRPHGPRLQHHPQRRLVRRRAPAGGGARAGHDPAHEHVPRRHAFVPRPRLLPLHPLPRPPAP